MKNIVHQLDDPNQAKVEGDNVDKDQVVCTGLGAPDHHHDIEENDLENDDDHHDNEDYDVDYDDDYNDYRHIEDYDRDHNDNHNDKYNVDKDQVVCVWLLTAGDPDHDCHNDRYVGDDDAQNLLGM